MSSRSAAVVVAALCLLAGCSGFEAQGDAAGQETVTPAPVPSLPDEHAEGVSEHGVDAPTIASNHEAALANRSYTTRTRIQWQDGNGSTYADTTAHRVAAGGEAFHVTAEYGPLRSDDNRTGHELWSDGNRTLLRLHNGSGEAEYRQLDSPHHVEYPRAHMINTLFRHLQPREVSRTSNGSTVVSGAIEDPDESPGLPRFRDERDATMSARITPDGYVDRVAIGFDATVQEDPVEVRITLDVTEVGSTDVSEPGWTENVSRPHDSQTPTE